MIHRLKILNFPI